MTTFGDSESMLGCERSHGRVSEQGLPILIEVRNYGTSRVYHVHVYHEGSLISRLSATST